MMMTTMTTTTTMMAKMRTMMKTMRKRTGSFQMRMDQLKRTGRLREPRTFIVLHWPKKPLRREEVMMLPVQPNND